MDADDTFLPSASHGTEGAAPTQVGPYRILDRLGEGGMGVVYVAEDGRLRRRVALKFIRADPGDAPARARLVREARIAAGISHPSICQVFELGDWQGQPFVAMELLEGEPLAARIARGALPVADALGAAVSVLAALSVLHQRGVVHGDLKPSNIFLTPHGIKILDFGMARPPIADPASADTRTRADGFTGTPRYAAPEQFLGSEVRHHADLFAVGVVLYEMLSGQPPFTGATFAAVMHAVLHDVPPVLTGSAAVTAADRVLYRALAKQPLERYADAEAFAADLEALLPLVSGETVAVARRIQRLAVLPFRLMKPDPAYEYLGPSLAEGLITALSGLESLVVRSSLKSARYADAALDLGTVASEMAVDVVLTGSILRVRDRFRVRAELVAVPAGDVLWADTAHVDEDAIFDLHEDLASKVVASMPLTAGDRARPSRTRPGSSKAYNLYLRGMQLRMEASSWRQARALFEQCVVLDPTFAPAWAERGRLDRVLGKFHDPALLRDAGAALERSLALDPENGAAHYYAAQLDIDLGRLDDALRRLLDRVRHRRAEPHVYAALVHACRYAGLLDESIAAHAHARRLDPAVPTSVLHTYYMRGEYARVLEDSHQASDPIEARALTAMGRTEDAVAAARRETERFAPFQVMRSFPAGLHAALEGRQADTVEILRPALESAMSDGEALFYIGGIYARSGLIDDAERLLWRSAAEGFLCLPAFEGDPLLAPLRARGLDRLVAHVRSKRVPVVEAFREAGGDALLGLPPAP